MIKLYMGDYYAISRHPRAPFFSEESWENSQLILEQVEQELLSRNMDTHAARMEWYRQAGLVSLHFFLTAILSHNGPYELVNDELHRDMCNFRQSGYCMDPGARAIIFMPRGHLKCVHADTKIFAEGRGEITARLLESGDRILGIDNFFSRTPLTVIHNIPGKEKGYCVKLKSGRSVTVGGGHRFRVFNGWKSVEQVRIGDRIAVLRNRGGGVEGSERDYLLGLIYGDGGVTGGQIGISTKDPEIVDFLIRYWGKVKKTQYKDRCPAYRLGGGMKWWKKIGLPLELSKDKKYPCIVEGSASFLRGLFDTDGTAGVASASVSFCSASKELAYGVLRNLQYFGIYASTCCISTPSLHGKAYFVSIYGKDDLRRFSESIGFCIKRKRESLKKILEKANGNGNYRNTIPEQWRGQLPKGIKGDLRRRGLRIDNHYATTKHKVRKVCEHIGSNHLSWIYDNDIVWDVVVSIEATEEIPIAGVQVSSFENYADSQGIIHHNTSVFTHGGNTWEVTRNPEIRIRLANAKTERAKIFMHVSQRSIDSNSFYAELYPDCVPTSKSKRWNENEMTMPNRKRNYPEATIVPSGIFAASEGDHHDLIIGDDLIGLDDLDSERQENINMMRKKNWFTTSEKTLLINWTTGRIIVPCTRYGVQDVYQHCVDNAFKLVGYPMYDFSPNKNGKWVIYNREIEEDGDFIYPQAFNKEGLEELLRDDPWTANLQYRNNPIKSGLLEFADLSVKEAVLEYKERIGYFITLLDDYNFQEEDEGNRKFLLSECDVLMTLEPAATKSGINAKTSRTAIEVWALTYDGDYILLTAKVGYWEVIEWFEFLFEIVNEYHGTVHTCIVEANAMQKGLVGQLEAERVRRINDGSLKTWISFKGIPNTTDKIARIRSSYGVQLSKGRIYAVSPAGIPLKEEGKIFGATKYKIDALDAASMAIDNLIRPDSPQDVEDYEEAEQWFEVERSAVTGY